mmetsp:Transcript_61162/g.145673  ORF Transcript_61162/g.145673 Transcript_61162/m.145673 type:complete len:360 (+) Transcript_61162:177-1256(+)
MVSSVGRCFVLLLSIGVGLAFLSLVWYGPSATLVAPLPTAVATNTVNEVAHTTGSAVKVAPPTVAIVSAGYGGRGWMLELPEPPPAVKCVLYTDEKLEAEYHHGWSIVNFPYHAHAIKRWPELYAHGRLSWYNISTHKFYGNLMAAKFYKMNMYLLPELQGMELIFWIDSDMLFDWSNTSLLALTVPDVLRGADVAIEKHIWRDSEADEMWPAAEQLVEKMGVWQAKYALRLRRNYWMRPFWDQQAFQKAEGFQDDVGLFQGSQFILNVSSPRVVAALQTWWHQVQVFQCRDQLSLPFALWKHQLSIVRLAPDSLGNLIHDGCIACNRTLHNHRFFYDKWQGRQRKRLYLEAMNATDAA